MAAVVGAGAVGLRSPEFHTLLWLRQDGFAGLFRLMIAETMLLAVVLGAAVLLIGWMRALAARMVPPLRGALPQAGAPRGRSDVRAGAVAGLGPWGRSLASAGLALVVGVALLTVLLQSTRRGQVIFALLLSFALAVWIAQRVLPATHVEGYLLAPLVAAVVLYVLASVASYPPHPEAWAAVPAYAQVLPIDWLTAGCGGAMLGCWIGQRMEEAKTAGPSRTGTGR